MILCPRCHKFELPDDDEGVCDKCFGEVNIEMCEELVEEQRRRDGLSDEEREAEDADEAMKADYYPYIFGDKKR